MNKTDEHVNRVIAEYIGYEYGSMSPDGGQVISVIRNGEPDYIPAYTASLDACMEVVQKLIKNPYISEINFYIHKDFYAASVYAVDDNNCRYTDKSPSKALAYALAEVIENMEKE